MTNSDEEGIRFHGAIEVTEAKQAPLAATIKFHRWNPTSLDVSLLWTGNVDECRAGANRLRTLRHNYLWLHSSDPPHPSVELLGISGTEAGGSEASVRVAAIQVGIQDTPEKHDAKFHVIVKLQPSGILSLPGVRKQYFTGNVQIEKVQEGVVEVETSIGNLEAQETYEFYSTIEHGNRVSHSVQRASIMGETLIAAGKSICKAHETLMRELDEVCVALSLCYRQPVDYYEISYIPIHETESAALEGNRYCVAGGPQ